MAKRKAYISGALASAPDIESARRKYAHLGKICKLASWHPYVPHSHTDPVLAGTLTPEEVASRDLLQLGSADVVIAYLGWPSLGVGAEVVYALDRSINVIGVVEEGRNVSRFVEGLLLQHPCGEFVRVSDDVDVETTLLDRLKLLTDRVS